MFSEPKREKGDRVSEAEQDEDRRNVPVEEEAAAGKPKVKKDVVRIASEDSFPASDPPSYTMGER